MDPSKRSDEASITFNVVRLKGVLMPEVQEIKFPVDELREISFYLGNLCTVACNYLSIRLTKTCSAGQSKFKVLTIKRQRLPAHFGTFWRHSANTSPEAKSATRTGILSSVVLNTLLEIPT